MAGAGWVTGGGADAALVGAVGREAGAEGAVSVAASRPGRGAAGPAVSLGRPETGPEPSSSPSLSLESAGGVVLAPRSTPRPRPVSRARNDERAGSADAGSSAGGDEGAGAVGGEAASARAASVRAASGAAGDSAGVPDAGDSAGVSEVGGSAGVSEVGGSTGVREDAALEDPVPEDPVPEVDVREEAAPGADVLSDHPKYEPQLPQKSSVGPLDAPHAGHARMNVTSLRRWAGRAGSPPGRRCAPGTWP
ncbi:hypothetical protein AB0945_33130 [Streptomyces sp. NPDC005474]|uniref:hypothetical protein n=1 Tax=Streptomyces sp. NPDC005474 TaxID=3154878 RepID=UPI0034549A97